MRPVLNKILQPIRRVVTLIAAPFVAAARWLLGLVLKAMDKLPYRQRGRGILSIVVVLFAAALAVWIGSGLFSGLDKPVRTVRAVEFTATTGQVCEGFVVRRESVITANDAITAQLLAEGQKVAAGQVVAKGYTSASAQEKQREISELEDELAQLNYAGAATDAADHIAMDVEIAQRLRQTAVLLNRGQYLSAAEDAAALKGLLLRRFSTAAELDVIRAEAEAVSSRIDMLDSELTGAVTEIHTQSAGYFSAAADGLESVLTPDTITALSVSQVENLSLPTVPSGAVGRIITGDEWFYLCVMDTQKLGSAWVGDTATVKFSGENAPTLSMEIRHVSQEEDGKVALVLAAERYMHLVTALRQQQAEVIFETYSGLRVPKQAVRVDENGNVGVYIMESANASWKRVKILYDNGESYVVELDKSSTYNLWPGDELIVSAAELYDGKVVY